MTIHELAALEQNRTAKQCADCSFAGEHYLHVYERYFEARRQQVKRVLEIGVLGGHSLRLWRDYFPNATILGMDINPDTMFTDDRIQTCVGDQSNPADLARLALGGPYDIIIDDASHITSHIITSFHALWLLIVSGGLYCMEDLRCTYHGTDSGWPGQKLNKFIPPYGERERMDMLIKSLINDLDNKRGDVRSMHVHCMQLIIEKV